MSSTIDYSSDDSVTWRNIGTRTATTSLGWTVPATELLTLLGRIRVKANDGKGGITGDHSDLAFEVDAIAVSTCSGGGGGGATRAVRGTTQTLRPMAKACG